MSAFMNRCRAGSEHTSRILGVLVILLAVASGFSELTLPEMARWLQAMFGPTFLVFLVVLLVTAFYCWSRMMRSGSPAERTWYTAGLQAANGIATLALTYTLLGISLGIGTLADQPLTPDTVQPIIRSLTEHFSLAFLTTVVGLPLSSLMRALLFVSQARLEDTHLQDLQETDHEIAGV